MCRQEISSVRRRYDSYDEFAGEFAETIGPVLADFAARCDGDYRRFNGPGPGHWYVDSWVSAGCYMKYGLTYADAVSLVSQVKSDSFRRWLDRVCYGCTAEGRRKKVP